MASADSNALMQILELGITQDIELINKALVAKHNNVEAAVEYIIQKSFMNAPAEETSPVIKSKPSSKPMDVEPAVKKQKKTVEQRKMELERAAEERKVKQAAEEKDREEKIAIMKENYEAYMLEKESRAADLQHRTELFTKKKEIKQVQNNEAKMERRMRWHAQQEKYASNENKLQQMVLKRRESEEEEMTNVTSAIITIADHDVRQAKETLTLICKILKNILKNPNEIKFRTIKRDVKRIDQCIVSPLGAERLLILIGFKRTLAELSLDTLNEELFQQTIEECTDVLKFIHDVQSCIRKDQLILWHMAVKHLLNHYSDNVDLPPSEQSDIMNEVLSSHVNSKEKQLMAVSILSYHERQLWSRHKLRPFFKNLKLSIVDEPYMKKAVKTLANIMKMAAADGETKVDRINLVKIGNKIPGMGSSKWLKVLLMCGYDHTTPELLSKKEDATPVFFDYLHTTLLEKARDLIDVV